MGRHKPSAKTILSSFHWFLLATFASAVGRNGYNIACSWLLAASGGGVVLVATFFITSSVIEMIISPVCGWICDRYDRRLLSIIADILRGSSAVGLCFLVSLEDFHWYVWLSTLVFATCDRLSLTAMQSMIPYVADGRSLPVANSATFFFMQFGSLVAAASIGLMLFVSTPAFSFLGMALCFAGSVFCMMFMTWEREAGTAKRDQSSPSLCIDAPLLKLGLIYCTLYLGGLLISAVGPTFIFEELEGNALDFGHLESAWSAGSILGAILLIPFARIAKPMTLQIIVLLITAIAFASIKLSSFPWALVAVCVLGATYNLGRVGIEVALQSIVPHAALGQAKGLLHCFAMAFGVALLGLIAILPDAISPTTIFVGYSALIVVSVVGLAVASPRKR